MGAGMKLANSLRKLHWLLGEQIGIDLIKLLRFPLQFPWYISSLRRFKSEYSGRDFLKPCLHDRADFAGSASNEYFIQDLLVAQMIHDNHPKRHIDVGSRVDGFVAHVASYREIEVLDIRPLPTISNRIKFIQHDIMKPLLPDTRRAFGGVDSISCLHALEHFGLGRYGDPINCEGWRAGFLRMAELLESGGTLYLSTPIGREAVYFNANWVFSPHSILDAASEGRLVCVEILKIASTAPVQKFGLDTKSLNELDNYDYSLCLFIFKKI